MRRSYSLAAALVCASAALAQPVFTNGSAILSNTASSGGCMAVVDMDGDGLDDIVQLDGSRDVFVLYRNTDNSFTTYDYGTVSGEGQWGWAIADLDNNGHKDVVSGGGYDSTHYLRITSRGVSTLTNLDGPEIFTQCMSIGDIDNNGRLDVFACHDDGPNNLWFTNASGVPVNNNAYINWMTDPDGDMSGNYGSTFTDFDRDGDIDLHISHCRQGVNNPDDVRRWDRLFVNDGNNQYADLALTYGVQNREQVWTSDFGDYDNDGDLDIFSTTHSSTLQLFENDGTGHYTEVTAGSGLGTHEGFFLQGLFRDLDNDGFLDIMTGSADLYFSGNGDGTFTHVTGLFPAAKNMHSFAFGDLNGDGFEDVYASYGEGYIDTDPGYPDRLWLNTPNGNHWLNVNLTGVQSNMDAVGAMVTIDGPWGTMIREVHAGESYGIVNSSVLHFGLGDHTTIPTLTITWPSGLVETYTDLHVDQTISVVEGVCSSPNVGIALSGPAVICTGDPAITLNADMGSGYSYTWSTGANTPSIDVSAGGTYSVVLADGSECPGQAVVNVIENPDQTPVVTVTGGTSVCETEGAVLTSSDADAYVWSNTLISQSITVTTSGSYSVTITGYCQDWTSTPIAIEVADAPEAPVANSVSIIVGTTADLSATGTNVAWYDVATGGTALATGNNWTTPTLFSTTSYWCADQNLSGGEIFNGGRTDNTTTGDDSNSGYYLLFNATEDMVIKSVKVYANGAGVRDIEVLDENNGTTIVSGSFTIPDGESRIDLNFSVPAGGPYGLRCTSEVIEMWRDGLGSDPTYPYALGEVGSITGTNVQGGNTLEYYYFFYDWEVQRPLVACESPRTEVIVEVGPQGINDGTVSGFSVYPVPTSALLTIDFGTLAGEVDMDLVDLTGRVVSAEHRTVKGNATLDVSGLARGEYTLRVRHANGLIVSRVVVR